MALAEDLIVLERIEKKKPWLRPAYLEWRKRYEKSDKYREKVRAYQAKRREDPEIRKTQSEYSYKSRNKHKIKILVRLALSRAKKNGTPYDEHYLRTLEGLRPELCVCCRHPLDYSSRGVGNRPPERAPSLDRVVTNNGYVEGNVAIICWRCNTLKRDASLEEVEAIAKYMREWK